MGMLATAADVPILDIAIDGRFLFFGRELQPGVRAFGGTAPAARNATERLLLRAYHLRSFAASHGKERSKVLMLEVAGSSLSRC